MQSQNQKIIQLIKSNDKENVKLGELTLLKVLNKNNALFWYLELEPIMQTIHADIAINIVELLQWPLYKPAMENIQNIIDHMSKNPPNVDTLEKFFNYYNQYLFGIISATWDKDKVSYNKNNLNI